MLILTDSLGVTIKRRIQDENHVRVGILQTALWINGAWRAVRLLGKPRCEYSLTDCAELLGELEYMERMV